MRILFVIPYLASPPRFGAQRRLDGLMRGLARSHEVSAISFVDPREDVEASLRETRRYCACVSLVPNERYALSTRRKRLLQMRSLLSPGSYERIVYRQDGLARLLRDHLAGRSYDVVNVEFMQMASNVPAARGASRAIFVLDEHNIEYDIVHRTGTASGRLDRKLYSHIDWRKLRHEERVAWRRFDGCTMTSSRDESLVRRDSPTTRTAVVPNAVDVDAFRPRGDAREEPMSLLFFGVPSYHPNKDGLLYFASEILPLIRARHAGARLRIVGPDVPPEIRALAGNGIEVVGFVEDVRRELERAAAVVVPLRIGGGTRFKILEAMAMERPVVSTTIGAEGLEVEDGRDVLLADTPADFAAQVVRLLDDAATRRRIGRAARAVIERGYSWGHSVAKLEAFYGQLLAERAA